MNIHIFFIFSHFIQSWVPSKIHLYFILRSPVSAVILNERTYLKLLSNFKGAIENANLCEVDKAGQLDI